MFVGCHDLLLFQHKEGFAREILSTNLFRIKNVAQFIAGETLEMSIVGIQFGAELGTVDFGPAEGPE